MLSYLALTSPSSPALYRIVLFVYLFALSNKLFLTSHGTLHSSQCPRFIPGDMVVTPDSCVVSCLLLWYWMNCVFLTWLYVALVLPCTSGLTYKAVPTMPVRFPVPCRRKRGKERRRKTTFPHNLWYSLFSSFSEMHLIVFLPNRIFGNALQVDHKHPQKTQNVYLWVHFWAKGLVDRSSTEAFAEVKSLVTRRSKRLHSGQPGAHMLTLALCLLWSLLHSKQSGLWFP